MAIYFVGDIQGCYSELQALLARVTFDPKQDQLYVAGDLVARGPDSLATLRLLKSLKNSVKIVLGNHDLHLLAVFNGIKKVKVQDKLHPLLKAPDVEELLQWLAKQPLIQKLPDEETYLSHAGLSPQWTPQIAMQQAAAAQQKLSSPEQTFWLEIMYGEQPNFWSEDHDEVMKFRYTINSLTRMRYCYANRHLDFDCKDTPAKADKALLPWYNFDHLPDGCQWLFGHWAALMGKCTKNNVFALDTGCVWGHHLTLLRWHDKKHFIEQAHKS